MLFVDKDTFNKMSTKQEIEILRMSCYWRNLFGSESDVMRECKNTKSSLSMRHGCKEFGEGNILSIRHHQLPTFQ